MQWDGEAMRVRPSFRRQADQMFCIGETYTMAPVEDRSAASHRHFFAAVNEAWANLPEGMGETYPTAEHLRKAALIRAGYRDERSIVCASKAEALRVAAFIKPMDEYALVAISEAVVRVFTAQSQSLRAMGKAAFQKSKDDVLEALAAMIGVRAEELHRAANDTAGQERAA
jgi:hypothetical protein